MDYSFLTGVLYNWTSSLIKYPIGSEISELLSKFLIYFFFFAVRGKIDLLEVSESRGN